MEPVLGTDETIEKNLTISPNLATYLTMQKEQQETTPWIYEMVFIQGGTFQMGSNERENQRPVHSVTVNSFSIGKCEVTQKQWRKIMDIDPQELNFKGCDQCPVEGVSWDDVQEFLLKLNTRTKKSYRLPTEAEWEFAARGGNQSRGYTYSGSDRIGDVAWYYDNSELKTHPVGQKRGNEQGIYDMSGNVLEWCSDWYGYYYYASSPSRNPIGPADGSNRVRRGGSFKGEPGLQRVAARVNLYSPSSDTFITGFRLVNTEQIPFQFPFLF